VPEGPTIVILREQTRRFAGQKILKAEGNAKIDMSRLAGSKVVAFRSWGKHFLIELADVAVRVHFLMFGSYTIDERKDRDPGLQPRFRKGEINFCSCAIRLVEGALDDTCDWTADVMSDQWDAAAARRKLRALVHQARIYSFEFMEWRRAFVLRQHWQVHNKGTCPACDGKLTRAWLGKTDRRSLFCEHCQRHYGGTPARPKKKRKS
jgi:endonuclease-8